MQNLNVIKPNQDSLGIVIFWKQLDASQSLPIIPCVATLGPPKSARGNWERLKYISRLEQDVQGDLRFF